MAEKTKQETLLLSRKLTAGFLAGVVAGLVMAVALVIVYPVFLGRNFLFPIQVISSLIYGENALRNVEFLMILTGVVLHMVPSIFWGLVLGLLVYMTGKKRGPGLFFLGIAVGVISQIVDVYVLVPVAYSIFQGVNFWADYVPDFWSWVAHLVYGVSLYSFAWIRRRMK